MNSPKVDIEDDISDNDSDGCQFTDQCHSKPQRKGQQRHRQQLHDSNRSSVSPSSNPDYQHQQPQRQQQQQQPSHASLSPRSREYLRLRVNARERQRMHDMNVALDALRRAMPYAQGPAVKKLSKMNTLLLARNYILLLTRTLDELRRLLVAANVSPASPATSASDFAAVGGTATQSSRPTTAGRPPGSSLAIDPARLEAALKGLIDGRGIYAEQQRYAEELVRREQQLEQEQRMLSASGLSGKASKRAAGNLDIIRNHVTSESPLQTHSKTQPNECTESNQKPLASPDTQMTNRKRKLYRPISPVSPPLPVPIKKSPTDADLEKGAAASGSEELHRQASGHMIRYPGERLIQYAVHPPAPTGPAQLMMMTSSRLPEMAATVGFAPSAAAMHAAMASSHAAAMMGHVISGPYPSCPCSHCVDSRPTYIVPVDFVAAATRF